MSIVAVSLSNGCIDKTVTMAMLGNMLTQKGEILWDPTLDKELQTTTDHGEKES